MSIRFSSTALLTAARIWTWLREEGAISAIFAGATLAAAGRVSSAGKGNALWGLTSGLLAAEGGATGCGMAGGGAGTAARRMSSSVGTENALRFAWVPHSF